MNLLSQKALLGLVLASSVSLMMTPARAQSGYFNAVTALSPAAYWPLQETVLPPAANVETNLGSLGAAANAYYSSTNAVQGFVPGAIQNSGDSAVEFSSGLNGGFLAVPLTYPGVTLPTGAFTVEAWIYPTNLNVATIVAQTGLAGTGGLNYGTNSAGWSLNQNYTPSHSGAALAGWSFHVYNGAGSAGGAEAAAAIPAAVNTWYHLVGVFDGTNAYLYVDGTNASATLGYQVPVNGAYVPDMWDPLTIGCGRGLNNNRFGGAIDEVAVYTNALTWLQVSNDYAQATSGAGDGAYTAAVFANNPYMYWRMDAPQPAPGTTGAYPVAMNYGTLTGLNGIYLPGSTPGMAGPQYAGFGNLTNACAFNGIGTSSTNTISLFTNGVGINAAAVANSGIMITNVPSALNLRSNNVTAMCWFKANPADGRFQTLLGHGDSSWRLSLDGGASGNPGKLHWNPGEGGELVSTRVYNDGQWHFVAGVYANGGTIATGTNYLYVDGALDTSGTVTTAATGSLTNVLLGGPPDYTHGGNGNVYNQRFFGGSLAHIAYFTNALTSAQIAGLYISANPNPLPPVISSQPVSGSSVAGGPGTSFHFGVTAMGIAPLTYQWYYNNAANYSGAVALVDNVVHYTGSQTLQVTVTNLAASDSGYYFVVVSNNYGAVTSSLASLSVALSPAIVAQTPAGGTLTLFPNQSATLSVTALGAAPLTYQWYTNGVADTTAGTGASYLLTGVQPAMSGTTYQCVVANSDNSVTGALITLNVSQLPAGLSGNALATNILALNPVAYWPMHEVTAPAAGDIETNYGSLGLAGTGYYSDWLASGTVGHDTSGALGGDANPAVEFIGQSNSCMVVPHTSPLATLSPPFTLEAWVKPYNNTGFGVIMGQGGGQGLDGGANLGGFSLLWSGSPNCFSLTLFNGAGGGNTEPKTLPAYVPGQWYHVVSTFDGTNAIIYVNGAAAGLQTAATGTMNPDSWSPLCIGAGRWTASGPAHPFAGEMDEVAIYTNVLSADDIQNHYVAGTNASPATPYKTLVLNDNPLLYYRMDSSPYVTPPVSTWPGLTNYGSAGVNGVYNPDTIPGLVAGADFTTLPGSLGGMAEAQFNGMSSFADAGYAPAFNPVGAVPFTISVMFRGNPSDSRFQNIIGHSNNSWRLAMNTNGKLQATLGTNSVSVVNSTGTYNDGNWHQAVEVYTPSATVGASGTHALYVDGLLDTSVSTVTPNGILPGSTADVILGGDPQYTNSPIPVGRQFDGQVCDAALFGSALTATQIQGLYNAVGAAPVMVEQPVASRNINGGAGTYIYFGAEASGSATLGYQWYFNSNPAYTGATELVNGSKYAFANTDQLTVTNLTGSDEGYYFVVVTNNYGSVTSLLASLTVNTTPQVVGQAPETYTNPFTLFAGASPAFAVTAIGAAPISYQWYTNGVPVAGAVNANFAMADVQGSFTTYCILANSYGSATSVWSATVIADPTATFPQAVLADNPVGYWRFNDADDGSSQPDGISDGNDGVVCHDYMGGNDGLYTNVSLGFPGYSPGTDPGDTSALFGQSGVSFVNSEAAVIQNVDFASSTTTNFTVAVWANGFGNGAMTTGDAVVSKGVYSLNDAFVIDIGSTTGHPYRFYIRSANGTVYNCTSTHVPDGGWHYLVGVCNETAGLVSFYIDGALAASTSIPTTAGVYESDYPMTVGCVQNASETAPFSLQFEGYINDLAVYNHALSAAQISAQFSASGTPPIITQQPVANTNVSQGGTLVLQSAVTGTAPLGIQWWDYNSGTALAGKTNATLVVSNFTVSDSYYFVATNHYGSTNSAVANVNVVSGAPQIYTDIVPLSWQAYAGSQVAFTVTAFGTAPLYYQWYQNGLAISGATNSSYALSVLPGTNTYACVVNNTFNGSSAATSSTATVVGVSLPTDGYSQLVLSRQPIAYWQLAETSGSIAYDNQGGHNATYNNVQLGVTGSPTDPDLAAEFGTLAADNSFAGEIDNSASGLANIDFSTQANAEFSLEAWVNGGSSQVSSACFIGKGYSGSEQFVMDYYNNGFRFFVRDSANVTHTCQSTVRLDGNWHHLVGVCDQINGIMHLYVDGVDAADASIQAGKSVLEPAVSSLPAANLVSIGSRSTGSTATTLNYQFVGVMDDVAIYNEALDASQVQADYQAGSAVTPPTIDLTLTGHQLVINFTGTLLSATNAAGPYTPVAGAASPYTTSATNEQTFFRTSNP